MAGRLLDVMVLAEDVREALALAATKRGDGSLTTAQLLVEVMRLDRDASGWARIALYCRSPNEIDPAQWPDPRGDGSTTWEDVPLSEDLAAALRIAARLVDDYDLVPMPTVVLVLGLIATPDSGAARALLEGTGCTHAEVVELVQDSLAGGRFESLDLRNPSERDSGVPAARRTSAPLTRPAVSAPRRYIRGLGERWDWQRVKSLLAGLAFLGGAGGAVAVMVGGEVDATGATRVAVYLVYVGIAGVCLFHGVRRLRRAADSGAVAQRRRAERRRQVDGTRNVAAREVARSLSGPPTYTERLLEVLRKAADDAASSGTTTTREHVAVALGDKYELPATGTDEARSAEVLLNPEGDRLVLSVSQELAACLTQSERLAQTFAMNLVETGHLATALAFSVSHDLDDVRSRLRRYFGEDFVGVEEVFAPGATQASTGGHATPPPRILMSERTAGLRSAGRRSFLRVCYLAGALLLLWPIGRLLADAPRLLTDAGHLRHAVQALHQGRNEDAYRVFSEVADRRHESVIALEGRACAAARVGDLDRWAVSAQVALASGMPQRAAGFCLRPAHAARFHLVVAEGTAIIVPSPPPSGARREGFTLAAVPSGDRVVDVIMEASCSAGVGGLPTYAAGQARVALRLARYYSLANPSKVADRLRACIQVWPLSPSRDAVAKLVAK
jgi:hypothetical protein